MKREDIVKLIREVLEEMSTTGGVGGYMTPFAFKKQKKEGNTRNTFNSSLKEHNENITRKI